MVQNIFLFSLVLIIVLFLIQSVRLRHRDQQIHKLMESMYELEKQAGFGRLLTGIAHDLNTPLGALGCAWQTRRQAYDKLRGIIESEGGSMQDPEGVQKVLKALDSTRRVVDESLERSLEMVKHLLRVGRGEPEDPVVVKVREVMEGILRILDHQFKSGVTVVNDLNPELQVLAQPGGLGRVFANLLVNAHQAMDGVGEIHIISRLEEGNVHVSITDSGPGLAEGSEHLLFRSGWSSKECDQGSGLGLFISREIMQGFGGDISAKNSSTDGACLTVWLPVAAGENQ